MKIRRFIKKRRRKFDRWVDDLMAAEHASRQVRNSIEKHRLKSGERYISRDL